MNVFEQLGFDSQESANLVVRSDLIRALEKHINESQMTQSRAAELMGVSQPVISDLMRGKIDKFSIDKLINMASRAGLEISVNIHSAA